ncbi:MAG: LysR family transcriptional regulator [Pseudomonadota bacterium]
MRRLLRFRDLEYLLAVADHFSFGKAAEALGVSQPTLSNQIRKVEETLGQRVLRREGRHVSVTPEGREILGCVRDIMRAFAALDHVAGRRQAEARRALRFGAIPTTSPYLGPPMLEALRCEAGRDEVVFVEGLSDTLETMVAQGELDFAITATLPQNPMLASQSVGAERLVYVSAGPIPNDPFDSTGEQTPILLMQEGHCFRDTVYAAIARRNAKAIAALNYRIGPTSLATLVGLVKSGVGDALLPEPFVAAQPAVMEGAVTQLLEPTFFSRNIQMIQHAGRQQDPSLEHALELLCAVHEKAGAALGC